MLRFWVLRGLCAAVGLAAIATTTVAATPAVASTGAPCSGIGLTVSDAPTLAQVISSYPAGTTFCLGPGQYDLTSTVKPLTGDVLTGSGSGPGGTELRGDTVLTGWAATGGLYAHTGGVSSPALFGRCANGSACRYPDDVFWNGSFLHRVLAPCTTANVTAGAYCIDYTTRTIYVHDNPAGNTVSYATLPQAIAPGTNVVLQNFAVSHVAAQAQSAAVVVGSGSTAEGLAVSYSHGSGIKLTGVGPTVSNSVLFDNGQEGANGSNTNGVFVDNQVHDNNLLAFNASWDAGGAKFQGTTNLTVAGNQFYDNAGSGLWFDVDNTGAQIADNTSENNATVNGVGGDGIRIEVSCNMVITGNSLLSNERHGISIANSHNVTFGESGAGNTVSGNAASAILIVANGRVEAPRPLCHAAGGVYPTTNDVVQDNIIQIPPGLPIGFAISNGAPATGSAFRADTYTAASGCGSKLWKPIGGTKVAFTTWQSAGEDPAALGSCN